jgi:hypothetical protein
MIVFDLIYISRGMAAKWWLTLRIYSGLTAIAVLLYAYYG